MPKPDEQTATADGDSAEAQAPGGTIGRFVVERTLGAGGMGVVVAARDPALDRVVAIKLLRSSAEGEESRARLAREAQAMARVQHPNVATVYEVGTVGEQAFVAMELVDGTTLKGWLREQSRSAREVLAMLMAAGRGLAAVHAAGLVHRDFKPDNVLVGKDGRPRVSDFGLVGSGGAPGALGTAAVTLANAGTPGYMAPEQLRGEICDARSDQFSFCVTLYQALYDERPFAADAPEDLRHAPTARPRKRAAPAYLFDIVARGLQHDPAKRWPNMDALLIALRDDPAVAQRRSILAAVLIIAVGGGAFGLWRMRGAHCENARQRLAGIWDAGARETVHRAFVGSNVPLAEESFQRTAAVIDRWTNAWVGTHEEACRATHVDGRQSAALLDLRMTCLDRRRNALAALIQLWNGKLNDKAVDTAATAATALPPLDECSDVEALTSPLPLPTDPEQKKKIAVVRDHLDRILALAATSKWQEAATESAAARKEADAIGYAPVTAEAALRLAISKFRLNQKVAVELSEEAARQGALAHDDRLTAEAMIQTVLALSFNAMKPEHALEYSHAAEAAVLRAGDPPVLRGKLLAAQGRALLDAGKPKEAVVVLEQARPLLEKALGRDAPDTISAESRLASAQNELGDFDKARATNLRIAEVSRALGVDTPREASAYLSLGMVEEHAARYDEARAWYEKSLAIYTKRLGPENATIANLECNLANVDQFQGKLDDAAARYLKVKAMLQKVSGDDSPGIADVLNNLASVRVDQGRIAEAISLSEEALARGEKVYGKDNPKLGMFEDQYGSALIAKGQLAAARPHVERGVAILTKALGPEGPQTLNQVSNLAQLDARMGHCTEARPQLEKVAAQIEKVIGPNLALGNTLYALGQCEARAHDVAAAKKDYTRAVELLKKFGTPASAKEAETTLAKLR
jgi:tetratricopeptide (TPR) repeat protein